MNTVKKSDLDQFYTSEVAAKKCFEFLNKHIDISIFDVCIEPSAGMGALLNLLPEQNRIGIDLDPKTKEIIKKDFFEFDLEQYKNKKVLFLGNPPFGKNSNLAIKFFNCAATIAENIAFIVPKTFQKDSVKRKLNLKFVLVAEFDLPKKSFVLNGEAYDVPCCFQIWKRSKRNRSTKKIELKNNYFEFSKKEDCNFSIRRVGGNAGKAHLNIEDQSESSNYFLKYIGSVELSEFVNEINSIDFNKITTATAGVKSLSKPELIKILSKKIKDFN